MKKQRPVEPCPTSTCGETICSGCVDKLKIKEIKKKKNEARRKLEKLSNFHTGFEGGSSVKHLLKEGHLSDAAAAQQEFLFYSRMLPNPHTCIADDDLLWRLTKNGSKDPQPITDEQDQAEYKESLKERTKLRTVFPIIVPTPQDENIQNAQTIPCFCTLVVKRLQTDGDGIILIGTFVQRPLFTDLTKLSVMGITAIEKPHILMHTSTINLSKMHSFCGRSRRPPMCKRIVMMWWNRSESARA